jgi:hypothetical protein
MRVAGSYASALWRGVYALRRDRGIWMERCPTRNPLLVDVSGPLVAQAAPVGKEMP